MGLLIKKSGGGSYVQICLIVNGDDKSLCASGAFQNQTAEAAEHFSISAERQCHYFFVLRFVAQPPSLAGRAYYIVAF